MRLPRRGGVPRPATTLVAAVASPPAGPTAAQSRTMRCRPSLPSPGVVSSAGPTPSSPIRLGRRSPPGADRGEARPLRRRAGQPGVAGSPGRCRGDGRSDVAAVQDLLGALQDSIVAGHRSFARRSPGRGSRRATRSRRGGSSSDSGRAARRRAPSSRTSGPISAASAGGSGPNDRSAHPRGGRRRLAASRRAQTARRESRWPSSIGPDTTTGACRRASSRLANRPWRERSARSSRRPATTSASEGRWARRATSSPRRRGRGPRSCAGGRCRRREAHSHRRAKSMPWSGSRWPRRRTA